MNPQARTFVKSLINVWLMIYLSLCETKILMRTWHANHFFHRQFRINNVLKHYNILFFFKGCFSFFCNRLFFLKKLFLNWITQRMPPRNNQSLFCTFNSARKSVVFLFLILFENGFHIWSANLINFPLASDWLHCYISIFA